MSHLSDSSRHNSSQNSYSSQSSDNGSSSSSYSSRSMASGSTHSKINWVASRPETNSADTMQDSLRNGLVDHVYSDVTVKSFVEMVWGIDSDRAQIILDSTFDLDPFALTNYHNIVNRKNPKVSKPDLHEPFCRMSRKLLKDICELFDLEHTSELKMCFWDKGGVYCVARPTRDPKKFITRKPDILDIFIPRKAYRELLDPDIAKNPDFDATTTWGGPHCVVELKRTRLPTSDHASVAEETEETKPSVPYSITTGTSHYGSASKRSKRGKKSSRGAGRHDESSAAASSTSNLATSNCASEELSKGIVSGGSNASRKRPSTTIIDHGCPSKKRKINVSAAEVQLSQHALETLIPGTRHYTTGIIIDCFYIKLWYYDRTISIRTVEFDFNTPEGAASLGLVLFALSQANMKQVGFNPNLYKFIPPAPGAIIEEENIAGLERPARSIEDSHLCFKLESPESKTRVFPVQDVIVSYTRIQSRLPTSQIKEILQQAGHISDVDVSNRDLHILVTDRYKKIWEAKDVEEFKRVFLDCVECHYHARSTGNTLHRDISENNLTIYCPDSEAIVGAAGGTDSSDVKDPGVSRGILNDFDMAALVDSVMDPDGAIKIGTPQHHITGTLPFMARELVNVHRLPPKHFYRYDLESFFYLLIWAATHYDFKCSPSRLPTPSHSILEKWDNQDTAYDSKTAFRIDDLIKYRKPGWEDVWNQWIKPLFRMFKMSYLVIESASMDKESVFDHVTCDGLVTFERFMKVIGATRGLESPLVRDH